MSKRTTAKKNRKQKTSQPSVKAYAQALQDYLERRGPGDEDGAPAPERMRHTEQKPGANIHYTQSGLPTAEYHWRISPVIDELEKRGTIDHNDWHVATRYMRHYVGSWGSGPATAKFLPYYDRGFQSMTPPERRLAFGQQVRLARKNVHPMFHRVLDWLETSCADEEPLWKLGEKYYPHLSKSQQSAKASTVLHCGLGMLASFYGMEHRWSISEIEEITRTIRYQRETFEVEEKILKKSA